MRKPSNWKRNTRDNEESRFFVCLFWLLADRFWSVIGWLLLFWTCGEAAPHDRSSWLAANTHISGNTIGKGGIGVPQPFMLVPHDPSFVPGQGVRL